jgi:uncharacterized membrane protein YqjE
VSLIAEQTSHLVRDELRLAKAEITQKGKKVGIGVGFFGGTGLLALIGAGCLVAAAILALGRPVPDWAAALIVGAALLAVAGIGALIGMREVRQATPPLPADALAGIKTDLQTLKPRDRA